MKKYLFIMSTVLLLSCAAKRQQNDVDATGLTGSKISETESNVVNDFLDAELKKATYKTYKDFEIVVIEEALKKTKPLSDYEFNFYNRNWGKNHKWMMDSSQIKRLKIKLEKEKTYQWKTTDFKNLQITLLKYEDLRRIINTSAYLTLPKRIILYLSTPLIINKNSAFVSFNIGNGELGFDPIAHFTILMRKVNNKWIEDTMFEDGIFY